MTDTEVIEIVYEAFKGAPRPGFFAYHEKDCDECFAADLTWDSRTIDTITIEDLNLEFTSKILLLNPEGFRYYFPGLVRLCLQEPIPQLTYQVIHYLIPMIQKAETNRTPKRDKKKKENEKLPDSLKYFTLLTKSQKEATLTFLKYLESQEKELQLKRYRREEYSDTMGLDWLKQALEKAIEIWEGHVKPS